MVKLTMNVSLINYQLSGTLLPLRCKSTVWRNNRGSFHVGFPDHVGLLAKV